MSHLTKEVENEKLDLLVFGYACKLFRDDERAIFIDNGSHLIPWMGDDSLKIDRYDGRGALYDVTQHEPVAGAWDNLSPEEEEEERKCDKERYRSLYINDSEDHITQEEIIKRAQVGQDFSQVPYSYDETAMNEITEGSQDDSAASQPFTPPEGLLIPADMTTPENMKHHAIIERTATFIAQQGSQMEILMKVKQNSNRLFDFLSFNDPLHFYYKHLLSSIKSGEYTPISKDKSWSDEEGEDNTDDDHYLHPSLASIATKPVVAPPPLTAPPPPQVAPPPFENPPENIQKIVEKMVSYVVKNGRAFEAAIVKKKDNRFSFLQPKDPHHKYYKEQLAKREECIARTKINKNATAPAAPKEPPPPSKVVMVPQEDAPVSKSSSKKKPTPVCFSIKKPKESEGLEVPSALPVEDSTDEEEGMSPSPKPPSKPPSPTSELSEDSENLISGSASTKHKSSSSRSKGKRHSHRDKDSHLQKERKMKVAQFLKGIKNKS